MYRPRRSFALGVSLMLIGVAASALAGVIPRLDAGAAVPAAGPTAPAPAFVPSNLHPKLAAADVDFPPQFTDGCLVPFTGTVSPPCTYGPPAASRTIVLFGDSHAGQWAEALATEADRIGARLIVLTKASCPPQDLHIYLMEARAPYTSCDLWRRAAMARIAELHPTLVVVSSIRTYGWPGVPRAQFLVRQKRAMAATLTVLGQGSRVLLIADTPQFTTAPAICLARHLRSVSRCTVPATVALEPAYSAAERAAAAAAGAGYVSFDSLICPHGLCAPIHGDLLLYADGNHLSRTFTDALEPLLARTVEKLLPPAR